MAEYVSRDAAVCIANYAVDEHPYDKNPEQPETYSDYNQGWNDACDYIQARLENAEKADVEPVRHGEWAKSEDDWNSLTTITCSECHEEWCFETEEDVELLNYHYCPNCGARMDGGAGGEE